MGENMEISGKTAFITGGARGIGFAVAKKFLEAGAKVTIFSKTTSNLEGELDKDKTLIIEGDVTNRESVREAIAETVQKFGSLDILVNNAGVAKREWFMETDEKDWDFVIDVNLKGAFIVAQEAIKIMREEKGEKLVLNIASGAGIRGVDEIAVYSATKAGMIVWAQALGDELKDTNIKFITVAPGATDTKMFRDLFPGEKPYNTSEEVAGVVLGAATGEIKPDERLVVDVFRHFQNR